MPIEEALQIAYDKDLDLVLVSPNSKPPVCRIMNHGKYMFEKSKREKEQRRQSKANEMKEMRLSPNIGQHDLEVKSKKVKEFLEDGHKVKITMRFRGREFAKKNSAQELMNQFAKDLNEVSSVEKPPLMDGRIMYMILSKKK